MCIFQRKPEFASVLEPLEATTRNQEALTESSLKADAKPLTDKDTASTIAYGGNKKSSEDPNKATRKRGTQALTIGLNTGNQTGGGINV